jgi:hypothetical protein
LFQEVGLRLRTLADAPPKPVPEAEANKKKEEYQAKQEKAMKGVEEFKNTNKPD